MKKLALIVSFSLLSALPALAQPTMIQRFNDWGVYSYKDGDGGTVCYTLTVPRAQMPGNVDHGHNFFIVAAAGNKAYGPQARMGYELKPGSRVKVEIGDKTFWMFAKDKTVWLQHEKREPELIRAMRAGSEMTVAATSRRGTHTTYTYSLDGVTAALKKVNQCR